MKTCNICGEEYPLTEFFISRATKDGRTYRCKACNAVYKRKWRAAHPGRHEATNRASLLRTGYGLTVGDYTLMFNAQGGVCAICGSPPETEHLYVDHHHKSGKVRGLLCRGCNMALGHMKDDPRRFQIAATYLERG